MQVQKYRLETEMERLNKGNEDWFKGYIRQVLESDKPYFEKAEYIAYSINQVSAKVSFIENEIKTLQAIKKALSASKDLALEATASVLQGEYGIDRIEGAATVSSITVTPQKTKVKETLSILDEEALIKLGYFKVVLDVDAVKEAMQTLESMDEIDRFVQVEVNKEIIPARIKLNTRRNSTKHQASELLDLVDTQEAA